jgi:cell division protein FtsB
MEIAHEIRRRLRLVAFPLFVACLSGYFMFHAIHGERGILAWLHLNQELKAANVEAVRLADVRVAMERRVTLLSNHSLDLDLLDERARVMLNFAHPDDRIIFLESAPASGGAHAVD